MCCGFNIGIFSPGRRITHSAMSNVWRLFLALISISSFCLVSFIVYYCAKPLQTLSTPLEKMSSIVSRFPKHPNVLFIMCDDMRPEIRALYEPGSEYYSGIHTPNLDKLASQSLVLSRAYIQFSFCNPSRASLLTGRRPDSTYTLANRHYFRRDAGDFVTLPQYFKDNGYETFGMGKVFHRGPSRTNDDPPSWTRPYYSHDEAEHDTKQYWRPKFWEAVSKEKRAREPLPDDVLADQANKSLTMIAQGEIPSPFFLAVGIHKPHNPWVFPEEFLSYYKLEDIPMPRSRQFPKDVAPQAMTHDLYEHVKRYMIYESEINKRDLTLDQAEAEMRRAYYSALSYADSTLGRILNALEEQGLSDNTIVAFLSDHPYLIGEHGAWTKRYNFDGATRTPLMLRIPGATDGGMVHNHPVEFVDIFPTLVEAAGLPPMPLCPPNSARIRVCREGSSFLSVLTEPSSPWKSRAFSQMERFHMTVMGYTMRTDRYRYTEWVNYTATEHRPDWTALHGAELYDYYGKDGETVNLAYQEEYAGLRQKLSEELRRGWRGSLPRSDPEYTALAPG